MTFDEMLAQVLALLQREKAAQEVGDFRRPRVRDSKTGHAELWGWGQTSPEIGDIDGDERWPTCSPEEGRYSFVLDDRVGS